jgi:hypothetical protein
MALELTNEELGNLAEQTADDFQVDSGAEGTFDGLENLFTGLAVYLERASLGELQDYLKIAETRLNEES